MDHAHVQPYRHTRRQALRRYLTSREFPAFVLFARKGGFYTLVVALLAEFGLNEVFPPAWIATIVTLVILVTFLKNVFKYRDPDYPAARRNHV